MRRQFVSCVMASTFILSACAVTGTGAETRDRDASGPTRAATTAGVTDVPDQGRPERRDGVIADQKALLATFSLILAGDERGSRHLVLATHGSSSCPWRVTDVQEIGDDALRITVSSGKRGQPCTLDDARRRERVELPPGMQAGQVTEAVLSTPRGASHPVTVSAPDR